jgi:curved DNA-binding protein CbpA
MSVRELKHFLDARGVSYEGIFEKDDLRKLVEESRHIAERKHTTERKSASEVRATSVESRKQRTQTKINEFMKIQAAAKVLGVGFDAPDEVVQAAHKALLKAYHPDRHNGAKQYEEKFKDVSAAYETLSAVSLASRISMLRASERYYEKVRTRKQIEQQQLQQIQHNEQQQLRQIQHNEQQQLRQIQQQQQQKQLEQQSSIALQQGLPPRPLSQEKTLNIQGNPPIHVYANQINVQFNVNMQVPSNSVQEKQLSKVIKPIDMKREDCRPVEEIMPLDMVCELAMNACAECHIVISTIVYRCCGLLANDDLPCKKEPSRTRNTSSMQGIRPTIV